MDVIKCSSQMPLAPVDSNGTQLFYEDSGAPPHTSSYVTLVLIHGAVFHGTIYRRILKHATNHDLRLVAVNLRDYPGSSRFTASELDPLGKSDKESQALLYKARGHELASFLIWFIRNEKIPPLITEEGKATGGLSLLSWSWGTTMTISMLAHAESLPLEFQELLDKYWRSHIAFDTPAYALGAPTPAVEEMYSPLSDRSIPLEDVGQVTSLWVSSYFAHSQSVINSLPSLPRDEFFSGLAKVAMPDLPASRAPTLQRMTAAELAEVSDPSVIDRSHLLMVSVDPSILSDNLRRVLCKSSIWPRLRAIFVWCEMSPPEMVYGAWYMCKLIGETQSSDGREVVIERMASANHFVMWEEPEIALDFLAKLV